LSEDSKNKDVILEHPNHGDIILEVPEAYTSDQIQEYAQGIDFDTMLNSPQEPIETEDTSAQGVYADIGVDNSNLGAVNPEEDLQFLSNMATELAKFMSPGTDIKDAVAASGKTMQALKSGNPGEATLGIAQMFAGIIGALVPGSQKIKSAGKAVGKQLDEALQPNMPTKGYHGTVGKEMSVTRYDKELSNPKDMFLGPGFYVTIEPKIAGEYANFRAIKGKIVPSTKDQKKRLLETKEGQVFKEDSQEIAKGLDIEGKPINAGQNVLPLDISKLEKTYMVKDNKDRLWAIKNRDKLIEQGYDSIAFENFADRSKQIVIFPKAVHKVKGLARGKTKGKTREEVEVQGGPLSRKFEETQIGRILDEHGVEWEYHENGGVTAIEEFSKGPSKKKYFGPNTTLKTLRNWLGY